MKKSGNKICWVIANPLTINFFLRDHIAMLARDYELTVVTNTRDPKFLTDLGVPLRLIPMSIARDVQPWSDVKALLSLVWLFWREKFDVVHSLSPKTGLLAILAAWLTRVPVRLHTFQGEVWITRKGLWRAVLIFLDKLVASCATHLTVVSFSERQFLIDQRIASAEKLQVLGHGSICGVDIQRFKPDPQARGELRRRLGIAETEIIFIFVGRLNRDKGLLDLAHAFVRVSKAHPGAHLLMVGPDEAKIRADVESIGASVSGRLHFADYTAHPEQYMAACDVLCLPSYREGFGLVLIEAAATGLPTIGSRIYGITDAIADGQSGLLCNPADPDDLAEKMERLVNDSELRAKLGTFGMIRARETFAKELVLCQMLNLYQRLLPTVRNA